MSISVLPLPAGEPCGDLLEDPAVAIGIAERRPREVRAASVLEARRPCLLHLADLDAAADEVVAGCVDVADHENQPGSGPRLRRCPSLAELDRAARVGRRELHRPEVVADHQVDVEPPSQARIEALCAIDVRDRQGHDLEVHGDGAYFGGRRRSGIAYVGTAHGYLQDSTGFSLRGA